MSSSLEGKRFVLAGDLGDDRSTLKRKLMKLGVVVGSVVTRGTDVLFTGDHPKLSKTEKAEELGVLVLGAKELRRTLETGSLQTTVEEASEEEAEHDTTPFPRLSTVPRDGELVLHHPSGEIRARGSRVDGLSHGTWKYFHADGTLSDEIQFERGLRVGAAVGFYEDGTKKYEGAYAGGHKNGPWDWWYEGGAFKQRYIYDAEGKTHGPYVWDLEDGSPRARGEFWHGTRHGDWEWHGEPKHERMIRGYRRGHNHGRDAGWYPGGQLAYSRHWEEGQRVGDWVEHYEDGSPKLKCTYAAGVLVGEHRTWDESGAETLTVYVDGLRESVRNDDALHAEVVAKVNKARSDHKKRDAVSNAVDYAESGPFLLHLWRAGKLELEAIPELWEGLRWKPFRPDEVMAFLAKVKKPALEKAYSEFLPCWPRQLDELVCHAYARDPQAFEGWRSLPADSKFGVAFVLARAGVERASWEDVLATRFGQLVKRHVHGYGLGERIWWWVDGRLEEVHLYERRPEKQHRREPLPRFYELIELFGTRDAWAKAVLRETVKHTKKERRVPWESARDGLALATPKQLIPMLEQSGYEPAVEEVFRDVRDDDADVLEDLATSVEPGRAKFVALCAALKRLDADEPISDALLEVLPLDVGNYSSQWIDRPIQQLPFEDTKHDPAYLDAMVDFREMRRGFSNTLMFEVFERMSAEQQRARIEAALDSRYGKTSAVPFLSPVDDPALWKRGIDAVLAAEDRSERTAIGLAMLPEEALPLLVEAHQAAKKKMKEIFHRAILGLLARLGDAGVSWDSTYDAFIRTDVPVESYQYEYNWRFLRKIIHRLGSERAEAAMMRMLDVRRPTAFARAFRFLGSHETPTLIRHAIRSLLELEGSLQPDHNISLTDGLRSLTDKRQLIAWILRNGGGASTKAVLENALGPDEWKKLQNELRNEGVDETDELGPIERLVRDAKKHSTGSTTRIYALRPSDDAPEEGSLNVRHGVAPGVGADRWPQFEGEPMVHLFTIDMTMVGLNTGMLREKRAVSVFISDPDDNRAWGPGNAHSAVLFSTADQLSAASSPPEGVERQEAASFEIVPIDVPADLFTGRSTLRTSVYRLGARAGGQPIWLQDDEGVNARFIMQFDETFVGVNLGDMGVMYVFDETAFWQCH